jgi:hypothetical protein
MPTSHQDNFVAVHGARTADPKAGCPVLCDEAILSPLSCPPCHLAALKKVPYKAVHGLLHSPMPSALRMDWVATGPKGTESNSATTAVWREGLSGGSPASDSLSVLLW